MRIYTGYDPELQSRTSAVSHRFLAHGKVIDRQPPAPQAGALPIEQILVSLRE